MKGRVVGPPLAEADVAELDELGRDEREDELEQRLEAASATLPLAEFERETSTAATAVVSEAADEDFTLERGETAGTGEDGDTVVIEPDEPADGFEVPDDRPERPFPETFVLLHFVEVAMVLPSTNPVLVLEEADGGGRQLRIPIGTPEGVAIAYAARQLRTARPLTHELVISLLEAYNVTVETVRITSVRGAAYEAEIVCSGPNGMQTVPCRPSDAVALALRQHLSAPIVCVPWVLDEAGVSPRRRR